MGISIRDTYPTAYSTEVENEDRKHERAFYLQKQTDTQGPKQTGTQQRRKKESLQPASAVLYVLIFILVVSSKLILVQLPGAAGPFIKPLERC